MKKIMTEKPRYQDLEIWKRSFQLSLFVYKITQDFPGEEKFGLVSQMRRCSVSIPSNIAEGSMRGGKKEFLNFLHIAIASAAELQTQLLLSSELNFIPKNQHQTIDQEIVQIMKMINAFIKNLKS